MEDMDVDVGVVVDQVDSLLAVLMRDIDSGTTEVDGVEIHACLSAARALLATAMV